MPKPDLAQRSPARASTWIGLPNDIGVQRREKERAQRPTRPSVCGGELGLVLRDQVSVPPSRRGINLFDDVDPNTCRIEEAEATLAKGLIS